MIALVDCNNFYASCERVFQPQYRGVPIVVLSNNDGCVIARSNEAKQMGIQMGDAYFQIQELLERKYVKVFSSNYALYGDMSARVMCTLGSFTPDLEVYSIDESFLGLDGFRHYDLEQYATEIKETTYRHTGIPVGIGVAPTKTLAKAANRFAKKMCPGGVFVMNTEEKRLDVLNWLQLEDVWGIGRRNELFFEERHQVKTALQFSHLHEDFVRKKMGVVGVRLWHELRGRRCLEIETQPDPKQNICTSRSFPSDIRDRDELRAAIATHATRCAEKLRKQKSCAGLLNVFVLTNPFQSREAPYSANIPIKLNTATNSTRELIFYAMRAFDKIWKPRAFKKCGVIVGEIVPQDHVQFSMFDKVDRPKDTRLMVAMDGINKKWGQDKTKFAVLAGGKEWKMRREHLSQCYTTDWNDILKIRL